MSSTTVAEFASELKKSPDTLLEQLRSAGVAKAATSDALSEADKQKLLGFLQASHGTAAPERRKITLVIFFGNIPMLIWNKSKRLYILSREEYSSFLYICWC